jgi:cytochrome c biogenesis protein CcdA
LVITIGLADSLNPSTVGPALFLASGAAPRRAVLRFTFGVLVVEALGGLLIVLGPGEALLALLPHPGATTRYILETIAGAVMLIGAPAVWQARRWTGRWQHKREDAPRMRGARSPGLLGATITVVDLPTAFPYFAAIAAIVGSGLSLPQRIIALLVYDACFVLPLLGILAVLWLTPDRAARILTGIRDYLRRHWPVLLAVVALVAGMFVLALGITGLLGQGHGQVAQLSRHVRRLISH